MILSQQDLLSDNQALTATAVSTNILDLGATGTIYGTTAAIARDIGKGCCSIELLIQATSLFTSAGATTLAIELQTDDNAGFASPKVVMTVGPIAKVDMVAGWKLPMQYVPDGIAERYFRLNYVVTTGPFTAGNLTAGITLGRQTNG